MTFLLEYMPILILIAGLLLGRSALGRTRLPHVALWREASIFAVAYLVYFLVRGLVKSQVALAQEHAGWIIDAERRLGIFWESALQRVALDAGWPITLANWAYVWLYWPVLAATLVWLFVRHRPDYALYRNAVLLSGGLALLIFASFPVAPPRFAEGLSFVDTVGTHSRSYQLLFPGSLANLYAAMPSLHQGWTLLMGLAIATHASTRLWRSIGVALPLIMLASIVTTGNHYFLDALAGALVALTGLGLAYLLAHRARLWTALTRVGPFHRPARRLRLAPLLGR
jgi:hypothetical protein